MTQLTESVATAPVAEQDLGDAVHRVLQKSPEPLTPSKIRAQLPTPLRSMDLEKLTEFLRRQVGAKLYQYPKYRSQQDRFWDRPMAMHIAALVDSALEGPPLGWAELRRKLPAYAYGELEVVVREQLSKGKLFKHPKIGRGGERFGSRPADPKTYLREELPALFQRLQSLGFSQEQLRAGALELLHDEEWSLVRPPAEPAATSAVPGSSEALKAAAVPEANPPAASSQSSTQSEATNQ
jgi:hypothetical protein